MLTKIDSNAPLAHLQHDCGTQLLEGLSQSSSIATENERPATATTPKGSSPARRPKFFLKIEQARERGETEAERDTDRDMDIDQ
jgi:hypothetical protein